MGSFLFFFFFSSRRRHTRLQGDWSSDVCSSDLVLLPSRPAHPRDRAPVRRECSVEIGRASCREKSVDLGGRRIIKKKKKKRPIEKQRKHETAASTITYGDEE